MAHKTHWRNTETDRDTLKTQKIQWNTGNRTQQQ